MNRSHSWQNSRRICLDPADIPMALRTKNPAVVMVLGMISSKGDVTPPHFFSVGLKIKQRVYLKVLKKPWMKRVNILRADTLNRSCYVLSK